MTDIVERLSVRWEKIPRAAAYKIDRILLERKEAAYTIETLRAALSRQSDNMAFVINHMDLPPQWHLKFTKELDEDRASLGEQHD